MDYLVETEFGGGEFCRTAKEALALRDRMREEVVGAAVVVYQVKRISWREVAQEAQEQ